MKYYEVIVTIMVIIKHKIITAFKLRGPFDRRHWRQKPYIQIVTDSRTKSKPKASINLKLFEY